jgi:hypothetical protein
MGDVVRLATRRRPPAKVETSPAFETAWLAYPEVGRLRSSRKEAWPEWCAAAAELGENDLVARVKRYAAEDKEHRKEQGAPGFHRWLKWGRWEHWAPVAPLVAPGAIFSDPPLRAAFHLRFREESARKWFDRARLDGKWLVCPPARAEWINGPFKTWALAQGIEGIRFL